MTFLHRAFLTMILVTLTLTMHSVGMAALIQWLKVQFPKGIQPLGVFRDSVLVVRFTSLLVCLHGVEILLWASFYRLKCFANWEAAFYFSAADYSSVGAGDLLLNPIWRTLGPVESVTGVLMCGLSASFLFAIVTRLVQVDDLGQYDCVLIVTDHSDYDYRPIVGEAQLIVDTRNAIKGIESPNIVRC